MMVSNDDDAEDSGDGRGDLAPGAVGPRAAQFGGCDREPLDKEEDDRHRPAGVLDQATTWDPWTAVGIAVGERHAAPHLPAVLGRRHAHLMRD